MYSLRIYTIRVLEEEEGRLMRVHLWQHPRSDGPMYRGLLASTAMPGRKVASPRTELLELLEALLED